MRVVGIFLLACLCSGCLAFTGMDVSVSQAFYKGTEYDGYDVGVSMSFEPVGKEVDEPVERVEAAVDKVLYFPERMPSAWYAARDRDLEPLETDKHYD